MSVISVNFWSAHEIDNYYSCPDTMDVWFISRPPEAKPGWYWQENSDPPIGPYKLRLAALKAMNAYVDGDIQFTEKATIHDLPIDRRRE